ncbi:hypothetical protein MLD38_038381 [Melastoma candidum]|uniref:Uncharacterized protein n=1 Tax=Melastoma candidum TaxID=119954 RepID=A0ACB9KZK0_9MYRT|nr:hypothetical protein MLD38_038381 [Melastoma candidum]
MYVLYKKTKVLTRERERESVLVRCGRVGSVLDAALNAHQAALEDLLNANSILTFAVFLGLSVVNPGSATINLQGDKKCDADPSVFNNLAVNEVLSFTFYLLSSLVEAGHQPPLQAGHQPPAQQVDTGFHALHLHMGIDPRLHVPHHLNARTHRDPARQAFVRELLHAPCLRVADRPRHHRAHHLGAYVRKFPSRSSKPV